MTPAVLTLLDADATRIIVAAVLDQRLAESEARLLAAIARPAAPEPSDGMLTPSALAERLAMSNRELLRAVAEGRVPPPVYLGARSPRWPLKRIRAWEAQGCPPTGPERMPRIGA